VAQVFQPVRRATQGGDAPPTLSRTAEDAESAPRSEWAGPRARPPALTNAAEEHRAGERGRSGEFAVDVLDSADGGVEVEFGGDALATGLAVCLGSLAIPKQVEDGLGHACHIAEWH